MIIKEVIRQLVKPYEVDDEAIEVICFMNDLDANSEVEDKVKVARTAIELMLQQYPLNGVNEGGISFSYDTEAVKEKVFTLCNKYGLSTSLFFKPKARITRL